MNRKHSSDSERLRNGWVRYCLLVGLVVAFIWSYWPTAKVLFNTWESEPDYSHGYLVIPLSSFFLWIRRDRMRVLTSRPMIGLGVLLIVISIGLRMLAARYFMKSIDGWSIMPWVAGMALLLGGWRMLVWSWPSITFLIFMVPLPYRMEGWLSIPLQQAATKMSCVLLRCFGQPAFAEGNTILLGEQQLYVEESCSGLRIFVGIVALAFAYLIATKRDWWEQILLIVSAVPIALVSNSARIVVTGLLYQLVSGETAQRFSHDVAGWFMIPLAALLFALLLWFLSCAMREVRTFELREVLQSSHLQT